MAAQDDSIKARMTCIGQINLCESAEYVHFQCTHQPIHGAHVCSLQVIQRSLLSSFRAIVGLCELLCWYPGLLLIHASFYIIVSGCFVLLYCYKMGFRVFNYFSSVVVKYAFSSFI